MINYLLGYNLLFSYVAEIGFHVIALCNSVNNFSFTSCFIRVFLYNVYSMRYSKYETSVFVILFHLWQTIHNKFSYERNDLTVFSTAYTHFQNFASYFQNFTHRSKNCTHKMPHNFCKMKHCIQNITNTSQKQAFANTFAIILIPVRFLCVYIENCVLCFAKSVLWNWKLSQRPRISVLFCRYGLCGSGVWVSGFRNCVTSKDFVCKQLKKHELLTLTIHC